MPSLRPTPAEVPRLRALPGAKPLATAPHTKGVVAKAGETNTRWPLGSLHAGHQAGARCSFVQGQAVGYPEVHSKGT